MKSTGEVMGFDSDFGAAFAKSQAAAYGSLPTEGRIFVSMANRDKRTMIFPIKVLADHGFEILATQGTAEVLRRNGIDARVVRKHFEGRGPAGEPTTVDLIDEGQIHLIVNTPARRHGRVLGPRGRLRDPHRRGARRRPVHHHGAGAGGRGAGHRGAAARRHRGAVAAGLGARHPLTPRAAYRRPATVDEVSWQQAPTPTRRRSTPGAALRVILLFVVASVRRRAGRPGVRAAGCRRNGGIEPRRTEGLDGVLFAPVLHGPWEHLMANTVPLLVFGFLLLLAGVRRWLVVTAAVWLVGGVGVWLTGGTGTVHVGASVLVFGWLSYLLLRGVFSRQAGQIGLGVLLLVLYGGVLWGVLPGQPGISWQGHLFGALGGGVAAWRLGRLDRATGESPGWP